MADRIGLEIESLSVSFGTKRVLNDINLFVEPGETLALIGPNGAGKTTLIRTISGVIKPESGTVRAAGLDLANLTASQRARYLAVVPQARKLPPDYTVWQTVILGRTPYLGWLGQLGIQDRDRTRWALERANATGLAERRTGELSGGEQQRVLLARSLAQETPILLLDEPTAHLDMKHQSDLLNLIRELAQEQGLTILMALHDLNLVALYADRVALLVDGRLKAIGSPQEVLTSQELTEAYGVPIHIIPHPIYGTPLILFDGYKVEKV